jgi:hypothetical protein
MDPARVQHVLQQGWRVWKSVAMWNDNTSKLLIPPDWVDMEQSKSNRRSFDFAALRSG